MSSVRSEAAGDNVTEIGDASSYRSDESTLPSNREAFDDDASSGRGSPTKRSRKDSGLTAEQRAIIERNRQCPLNQAIKTGLLVNEPS